MSSTISKILFLLVLTSCLCYQRETPTAEFADFMEGFFGYYGISDIQPVLACFDEFESYLFLYWIQKIQIFTITLSEGFKGQYTLSQLALLQSSNDLEYGFKCFTNTTAYSDLVQNLNLSKNVDTVKDQLSYYFQSFAPEWIDSSSIAYDEMVKSNYSGSGALYAASFKLAVYNSSQTTSYGILRAFYNGIFIWQNLSYPSDSIYCYNSTNAQSILDFYKGLADYVSKNTTLITNTFTNTQYFFATQGKQLYSKIDPNVIACMTNSTDDARLQNSIGFGLDPFDQNFIKANYYSAMTEPKLLLNYFKEISFYAAGAHSLSSNIDHGVSFGVYMRNIA